MCRPFSLLTTWWNDGTCSRLLHLFSCLSAPFRNRFRRTLNQIICLFQEEKKNDFEDSSTCDDHWEHVKMIIIVYHLQTRLPENTLLKRRLDMGNTQHEPTVPLWTSAWEKQPKVKRKRNKLRYLLISFEQTIPNKSSAAADLTRTTTSSSTNFTFLNC